MSVKKYAFIAVLGLAMAFLASQVSLETKSPFAKHSVVPVQGQQRGAWLPGKPNSPIRIHLHSPRGIAFEGNETTEVQAMVQFVREMENPVHFTWNIPDGVEVLQGEVSGHVTAIRPGEIFKASIVVTGIGIKELPRNISMTVATEINHQKIAATAVFASHDLQADGSRRARRERVPSSSGWFNKSDAESDEMPVNSPPKGLHF